MRRQRPRQLVQPLPQIQQPRLDIGHAQLVPPVAGQRRLRSLQHFVGDGVDGARKPAKQAGDIAIARVDVWRDLAGENTTSRLWNRTSSAIVSCNTVSVVAIDSRVCRATGTLRLIVIDDGRVERLLLLEKRCDRAAHRGREAALPAVGGGGRVILQSVVERGDLLFVRTGRWLREVGRQLLDGAIEGA